MEITEDQQQAYENVLLGEELGVWMDSPKGQYVLKAREAVKERVLEQFRIVDVTNVKKVRDLQRALDAAYVSVEWLLEAIRLGEQQEKILRAELEEGYES